MSIKKFNSDNNILLRTLFDYIVPFFNNKCNKTNLKGIKKENNLENKLKNIKTENLQFEEILFLEQLVLSNIKKTNKKDIKIKKEIKPEAHDFINFNLNENIGNEINEEIKYSLSLINKKEKTEEKGYFVSIKYEENNAEEKLDVSIEFNNYGLDKLNPLNKINKNKIKNQQNELYSFSIINKKSEEDKNSSNYSIKITYKGNYQEERLTINYKSTIGTYLNRRQEALHDFSDRVPGKFVNIFPESVMGGVLGFTYLGENFMGLRADLTGKKKKIVDIHESIHTDNEYETRILTDWIMSREKVKYVK